MKRRYEQGEIEEIASEVLATLFQQSEGATVLGLSGDLGAGKTTLTQAIAVGLGVKETVASPTFVIAKFYATDHADWDTLVHMDAYRIEDAAELAPLGWESILATPRTLVVVEWPDRIAEQLPANTTRLHISHDGDARHISTL